MVRLKTEFVSIASHELRSPITSIVAFAQTLLTEDQVFSYEERRHFLEIIESEGRRLGNLLGHILDLSRIESGKIGVTKGSFDINQLVLRTIETIRIPQGITITQSIPKTETIVCADSDRIKQVLTNIIDNAIKYSRGSIDIKVISENNWVVISIADNGMGIQPEEIDRIFEPFFQSRKKGNPKGTGLGLAISRGIIEAHGGSMWVESKLDKGSTFLFKLPKGSDCSE
jgi:signal transduction histidine kinase